MASESDKNEPTHAAASVPNETTGGAVPWGEHREQGPWHGDWDESPTLDDEVELGLRSAPPAPAPEPPVEEPLQPQPSRDSRRRSKTLARKQMLRERRRMLAEGTIPEIVDYDRPGHRSQCRSAKRPCLFVACRYHLYLDVNPVTGSIKLNFPDVEVWELEETCALDVAERGGITLEEVGDIMNLTRERIRQVEVTGLDKLKQGEISLETFVDGREIPPNQ